MKYCPTCNAKYEDSISFCAVDGEVLEDDATHIVGSVLDGQYNIESLLGKGGMGAVYCARHILLGDRVAIKILPPQMRNNAEWLRRFRREGQAARRFRHPNAVTVYDLRTTSEGLIYMVMEYVEGRTLDAELKRRGTFTAMDAFTVLEPVMSVLNAAHAMGVVHRDLKPENIMLGKPSEDGQPVTKLLDLGIAKMREIAGQEASGTTALTIAGQVLGTPFYMSPEQWGEVPDDGNVEIDGRADIYSLGVVIYELIAGRRPFLGLTLQELRREHVSVNARPLNEVVSTVPEAFGRAISRAMSKDRGQRQATAGELASELRAALGLAPLTGSSPSLNMGSSQSSSVPPETVLGFIDAAESTHENLSARNTSADVIGPTIITLDSPPRPQSGGGAPPPPQPPPLAATSLSQSMPPPPPSSSSPQLPATSYAPFDPNAQAYTGAYSPAAEPRKSSSKLPVIIAAAILLIGGGVGGWYLLSNRGESRGNTNSSNTSGDPGNKDNGNSGGATNATEALTYWLEIENAGPNGEAARVAGTVPLASSQSFKFHFTPHTGGYLYVVGPGPEGKPMTFLTAEPDEDSGVDSNSLEGGVEYIFPDDEENAQHWITLDKKAGTESYTIIFSPTRMTNPAFLDMSAGHELTDAEVTQLEELKAKHKANAPQTAVINGGGTEPAVSVKVPQSASSGPVIFDIRIEHK